MALITILASTALWDDVYTLHNYSLLNMGGTVNMMGYHSHNFVTVYRKRDFADIIKVSYQVTLS